MNTYCTQESNAILSAFISIDVSAVDHVVGVFGLLPALLDGHHTPHQSEHHCAHHQSNTETRICLVHGLWTVGAGRKQATSHRGTCTINNRALISFSVMVYLSYNYYTSHLIVLGTSLPLYERVTLTTILSKGERMCLGTGRWGSAALLVRDLLTTFQPPDLISPVRQGAMVLTAHRLTVLHSTDIALILYLLHSPVPGHFYHGSRDVIVILN